MKAFRKDFHWAVLFIALGEGLSLWYFNSPEIKALFDTWVQRGLRVIVWAGAVWFVYEAYNRVASDIREAAYIFRPSEEDSPIEVREVMPDGSTFYGPLGELVANIKRYRAADGQGDLNYWKNITKRYKDQKEIVKHSLNQESFCRNAAAKPKPAAPQMEWKV